MNQAERASQPPTERFLMAQAEQIRQRVRAELQELDSRLHEKDKMLITVENRITDLQLQLVEKQLLLDARNIEINDLKVAVNRLSQKPTPLRSADAEHDQRAESVARATSAKSGLGQKEWALEDKANGENHNADFSLGEPNLTEAQKNRLARFQELSVAVDCETENKQFGTRGRRWRSNSGWKRRWKIWT